jgi:hypothetical protein
MTRSMWQPNNAQWWILAVVTLLIVFAWPPQGDRSLAMKIVNWAVDPAGRLPVLPDPLALGHGDDPDAVAEHDMQVQRYDEMYLKGGWTRKRLELKVARDPFDPSTERQLLALLAAVTVLAVWRAGARHT